MKNFLLIVFLVLGVNVASSQNVFWFDLEALANNNTETSTVARLLSTNVVSPQKPLITRGDTLYKEHKLIENFVVFEHGGYRFTVYYQWTPSDGSIMNNQDCLTIYYRPIGTDNPENLRKFCDLYVNGTWDQYKDGRLIYLYDYAWNDTSRQEEYQKISSLALEYFTK
jgi:hypothetical protein